MKSYSKGLIILAFSVLIIFTFQQSELKSEKQNERIKLIEFQNKNQDDGIEFLKTEMNEHRNQIDRMKENNKLYSME